MIACFPRYLLKFNLRLESRNCISAHVSLHFDFRELLNELINVHESATDPHLNIVGLVYLDVDAPLPKLVDAFGLSKEQDLQFVFLRKLVQVISQDHVCSIALVADVNLLIQKVVLTQRSYLLEQLADF